MDNHTEIPAEMLDAAMKAIIKRALELDVRECGDDDCAKLAEAALEAAGIPALLAERDGLRFAHGELSEVTMEAQAEVRELRARVAEMEADSARLRFLIVESGMDGFNGRDAIDFIEAVMRERGHDEWTKEDEFEGWRRLLDEAMAARRGEGE